MHTKSFTLITWLASLCSTYAANVNPDSNNATFCVSHAVSPGQQQDIWDTFIREYYVVKAPGYISTLFHRYMVSDYIQHDPLLRSGAQYNIDALEKFWAEATYNMTLYHISDVKENLGWLHWRVQGGPTSAYPNETAVAEVYRFNGSCIVEHWDVHQSITNTTTNPIALF